MLGWSSSCGGACDCGGGEWPGPYILSLIFSSMRERPLAIVLFWSRSLSIFSRNSESFSVCFTGALFAKLLAAISKSDRREDNWEERLSNFSARSVWTFWSSTRFSISWVSIFLREVRFFFLGDFFSSVIVVTVFTTFLGILILCGADL